MASRATKKSPNDPTQNLGVRYTGVPHHPGEYAIDARTNAEIA